MIDLAKSFYKLKADPFRLVSDHRFSYQHPSYRKSLAYLKYATYREEGFVMVTGRPGTGKTTLINEVIAGIDPALIQTGVLVTTQLEANDLLNMFTSLFRMPVRGGSKSDMLLGIARYLERQRAEGRRVILMVDEAQGLKRDAVEELRMLSNLQKDGRPLLQIFLIGQEELRELVRSPEMEQLRQRIVAASHMAPLSEDDVLGYILHRLGVAGWHGDPAIEKAVIAIVSRYSEGIPRMVNLIMGRLLLRGCIEELHTLDRQQMAAVIRELQEELLIGGDELSLDELQLDLSGRHDGFLEPLAEPPLPDAAGRHAAAPAHEDIPVARDPELQEPERCAPRPAPVTPAAADDAMPQPGNERPVRSQPNGVPREFVNNNRHEQAPAGHAEAQVRVEQTRTVPAGPGKSFVLFTGLALLVVLMLFTAAISFGLLSIEANKEAMAVSKRIASRITELDSALSSRLSMQSRDHDNIMALKEGAPDVLEEREHLLRGLFPEATGLHLIAAPAVAADSTGADGEPDRMAVSQLLTAGRYQGYPPLEVHQSGTPEQHISAVQQINDPFSHEVVGYLKLSLPMSVLGDMLHALPDLKGYVEVQQKAPDGSYVAIASSGLVPAMPGEPGVVRRVNRDAWQLACWPSANYLDYLSGQGLWRLIGLVVFLVFSIMLFYIIIMKRGA